MITIYHIHFFRKNEYQVEKEYPKYFLQGKKMKDPQIIAAIIQGIFAILATTIAAYTAANIGKKIYNQEKLKSNLDIAKKDIEFLLAVENKHCEKHKSNEGTSYKNTIRDIIRSDYNLKWSGKFTPGRVKNP